VIVEENEMLSEGVDAGKNMGLQNLDSLFYHHITISSCNA